MVNLKDYIYESLLDEFDDIAKRQDIEIEEIQNAVSDIQSVLGNAKNYIQRKGAGGAPKYVHSWELRGPQNISPVFYRLANWDPSLIEDSPTIEIYGFVNTIQKWGELNIIVSYKNRQKVRLDIELKGDDCDKFTKIKKYITNVLFKDLNSIVSIFEQLKETIK